MGSAHAELSLFIGVEPCIPLMVAVSKEGMLTDFSCRFRRLNGLFMPP